MPYRIASSVAGIWLFMSAFCWHHTPERGFADLLVGLLLFLSGFCGMYLRSFRFFDGVLGAWLVASFFVLRAEFFVSRVHDGVLGLLILGLASIPGKDGAAYHDHWVREFDLNPRLDPRGLYQQELEG